MMGTQLPFFKNPYKCWIPSYVDYMERGLMPPSSKCIWCWSRPRSWKRMNFQLRCDCFFKPKSCNQKFSDYRWATRVQFLCHHTSSMPYVEENTSPQWIGNERRGYLPSMFIVWSCGRESIIIVLKKFATTSSPCLSKIYNANQHLTCQNVQGESFRSRGLVCFIRGSVC